MNSELLDKILGCSELPSLSAVAARIIDLTSDEDVSIDELAATIQNDQALAAKVLRTVNSSFYGLREPCSTVPRALVMLGLRPVKALALSFSLVSAVKDKADPEFDYVEYWRRALFTAIAAKAILERDGRSEEADEAFLGGLLQDIGVLAMYAGIGSEYLDLIAETQGEHASLGRRELETYELQHADIGAMLAARWKLPEQLVMPVKFHERPTAAPSSCARIVRAVALGNLVHESLTAENAAPAMRRAYERASHWFAMTGDDVDRIARATAEGADELSRLFSIDTGQSPDADAVLKRAGEEIERLQSEDPSLAAFAEPSSIMIDSDQIDDQTGVFNALGFRSVVRSATHMGAIKSLAVCVVIASVHGLRAAIKSQTEDAAGACARRVAAQLKDQFNPIGGVMGRLGDDLFGVVITGANRAVVSAQCDALRAAIFHADHEDDPRGELVASVGLAVLDPTSTPAFKSPEQLIAAAVQAARAAEQSGGNATRVFVPKAA